MVLKTVDQHDHDELCRISQQGLARAAETLTCLLRQPVSIDVADAWMSDRLAPEQLANGLELGIFLRVKGDINGGLLLVLSEACGRWLSQQLLKVETREDLLSEPVSSTLKEVGNIIASSFLASLDDQLGLRTFPAPPQIMRAPLADLLQSSQPCGDEACLVVRTLLRGANDAADKLQGAIYLFPEATTLQRLIARIRSL